MSLRAGLQAGLLNQSSAQVIDGSLRFDNDKTQYLTRTPGSAGNRNVWTWSGWVKKSNATEQLAMFSAGSSSGTSNATYGFLWFQNNGVLYFHNWDGQNNSAQTNATFRDTGWYHVVAQHDESASSKMRFYVNGIEQSLAYNLTTSTAINSTETHYIGVEPYSGGRKYYDGNMAQVYLIDGLALGPEYFGFTDPLTNTWRPKKFKAEGTTFNDGTVWSSGSTVTGGTLSGATYGFDGSLSASNYCNLQATNTSTTANVTFAVNFKNVTKVEVFVHSSSSSGDTRGTCETIGGETFTSPTLTSASQSFHTIYEGRAISLKNIGWGINQNGQTGTTSDGFRAFRINGEILIDSTTRNLAFGTNGFYLPMDGNSPIGQDKSGKGNNWTPVNFGGSVELDKATGALPILNTTQGGTRAGVSVFGSRGNKTVTVTVASKTGGGNAYFFDGVERDSLATIRGTTITFDTTDSSNDSHPFKLSSTDADSSSGTEYTDGVAYYINGSIVNGTDYVTNYETNSGGTGFRGIKWTVPHNVSTTYYYCTVHNGMGEGGRLTSTTDENKADPYAWKNVLALPLVGNKEDVSNSVNSGSSTKTVTVNNQATSTNRGNFYGESFDFDGSGDRLVLSNYGSDFTFDGDFTIECWLYIDDAGSIGYPNGDRQVAGVWTGVNGDWQINYAASGTHNLFQFLIYTGGGVSTLNTAVNSTPYVNRWVHLAVVRNSGSIKFYIDGISYGGSLSQSASFGQTSNTAVGGRVGGDSHTVAGSIQDFRIYKGAAKYTSDFVVPATSPDILPDTPSGVSGGSKLTKIIDGAVSFDGGDNTHLSIADSTDFDHASSFTWEGYFYLKSYDSSGSSILRHENDGLDWYINTSGNILFNQNTSTNLVNTGNGVMTLNKWTHIAVSHTGSVCKMFVDGVEKASATTSTVPDNVSGILYIGEAGDNNTYQWNGFISNLRFVNGTALYTSDFTPPSAPLTNVTNTKLLCCQKPIETPVGFTTETASGALPILNTNDDGTSVTSGNRSDDDSSSIVLALPLYNNSNDVHADIKGSGSNKTITENGNTAASSVQSQFYGGSYVFDGSGDNLTIPASDDFDFGTGAYTIEMWFRTTSDAGWLFYDAGSSNQGMRLCIGNNGGTSSNLGKLQFNEQVGNGDDPQNGISLVNDGNWHHVAVCRGASGDTTKMYVDGILEVTGSADRNFDNNNTVYIGQRSDGTGSDFNGYIQDIRVYKGVAKYTSNFNPVGTFLRPQFAVAPSTIFSLGNSAATTFNPFNTDINTVRGQETGYATLNPLSITYGSGTLTNGNLELTPAGSDWTNVNSTIAITGEKVYFEATGTDTPSASQSDNGRGAWIGLRRIKSQTSWAQNGTDSHSLTLNDMGYLRNGGSAIDAVGAKISEGDVVGFAYDGTNGTYEIFVNGVSKSSGSVLTTRYSAGDEMYVATASYPDGGGFVYGNFALNFGQKPFKFPPPDGFQPLNIANVRPSTVITRPNQYVGVTTYTGSITDTSSQTVTGLNFQSDLVWIKRRNGTNSHQLVDSVRGTGKWLESSSLEEENSTNTNGVLTSLNSDGFTLTGGSTNANLCCESGFTYVAWCWKAGGNKNTFNVDDVGYVSASDVNMSSGGLNSAGYNTTDTWSDDISGTPYTGSYPVTNAFDGDLTTTTMSTDGTTLTWTPATPVTGSRIRLYIYSETSSGTPTFTINGVPQGIPFDSSSYSSGWLTYSGTTINEVIWQRVSGTNQVRLAAVEVDGKILVDNGVTPPTLPSIANIGASVGTKQGFSIIKYAGSGSNGTIAHGLSQAPDFFFGRDLEDTGGSRDWIIYHKSIGATGRVKFTTGAESISSAFFQDLEPTDKVINVGTSNDINSTNDYVLYCWHDVPGLQKFGSYINPSSTGAFVELGFKPAVLIFKCVRNISSSNGLGDWIIKDTTRSPINNPSDGNTLVLNVSNAEDGYYTASQASVDILSNGFKIRHPGSSPGGDPGRLYIYAAWAEAPSFNLYGGQSNAR